MLIEFLPEDLEGVAFLRELPEFIAVRCLERILTFEGKRNNVPSFKKRLNLVRLCLLAHSLDSV